MECKEQRGDQSARPVCPLIYDGECRLCVSVKQKLEEAGIGRAEFDVQFLAHQSEAAKMILGSRYMAGRPDAASLIRPSGEVLQGLGAFLPLVPNLPGGKFLLWWSQFSSAKRLAEWGYRTVARNRYRWFGETKLPHRED